jgi:dTMP kinase
MFVTFEGPEGGGKSTALRKVGARLEAAGHQVVCTREPGAGHLGQEIRKLLLHGEDISPETELLLFLSDRANNVKQFILPALAQGQIVLCDRFADSTLVYQGYARDLDPEFIKAGNRFATQGLQPDLTLLFDLPPEVGLARISSKDRLDAQPLEFHDRIRTGFLQLAKQDAQRWRIVDAQLSPDVVGELAFQIVISNLKEAAR